jgi:hypothetical protein
MNQAQKEDVWTWGPYMDTARLTIVIDMDVISIPTNGHNRTRRTLSDSQTYASSLFISILYVYDRWFRVDVNPTVHAAADPSQPHCSSPQRNLRRGRQDQHATCTLWRRTCSRPNALHALRQPCQQQSGSSVSLFSIWNKGTHGADVFGWFIPGCFRDRLSEEAFLKQHL